MANKTKRVELRERVTFNDRHYGPGADVEVPADFPEDGDVDTTAEPTPERVFRKPSATPPNTGGVDTGEGLPRVANQFSTSISGKTADELDGMDKAALERLATGLNLRVERQDDEGNAEDGEPLKRDYVRALSVSAFGG
jgi:hypothetical protein